MLASHTVPAVAAAFAAVVDDDADDAPDVEPSPPVTLAAELQPARTRVTAAAPATARAVRER
ncbi:hypothetical protein [Salana multivorans]